MIIGLSGSFAAGKDTVARYLVKRGFVYHSLSDLLRQELKARGKPVTRENLVEVGNEIREKFGADELARRVLEKITQTGEKNSLCVSIRNPEEVEVLKKNSPFTLWFVDAPAQIRYKRAAKRSRTDDNFSSFSDFLKREAMENSANPYHQQLKRIAEMADAEIVNDKGIDALLKTVDELLTEREHKLNERL
ncbi:MAG: AAA family ATPase [Candidatus Doudnabacteria bacterium]|nr:AAA family ATPase [Candidatus Doudnabacteria bacterium]